MVKVLIDGLNIKITGHAGYADFGKDIVCASCSTAAIMTVNQIEVFGMLDCISYEISDALLEIKVIEKNDTIEKIINNLIFTLQNLEMQYPKNIKIKEN